MQDGSGDGRPSKSETTKNIPLRVLFVHGLESSPNGSKTRMLREQGFEVVAPDMHMGLRQLGRRNSVVRQALRLSEVRGALAGFALLSGWAIKRGSIAGVLGVSALAGGYVLARRKAIFGAALARSFDDCVAIVREAVTRDPPDIVVGSSWGGAVAVELVVEGAWSGPTILLAPAVHRVRAWARRGDASDVVAGLGARPSPARIVVFHDPSDDTVPFVDSVALARGAEVELRSVNAGGHRLLALLERGELARTIEELVKRA